MEISKTLGKNVNAASLFPSDIYTKNQFWNFKNYFWSS